MAASALNSCVPGSIAGQVYVLIPAEKQLSFTTYLASVVERYGMVPNLGSATDDRGFSVHVLDATSSSVRLWSENVLLSGYENQKLCGVYTEPHSDPGQYFVSVSPETIMDDPQKSRELLIAVTKDLRTDGYNVRETPVECSPLSKERRSETRR